MSDRTLQRNLGKMIDWAVYFPYIIKKTIFFCEGNSLFFFHFTLRNSFPVLFLFSWWFHSTNNNYSCMSIMFIYFHPIWTCFAELWFAEGWLKINFKLVHMTKYAFVFFVSQVLVSAFVIGWPSFRFYYVYYMRQHVFFISISTSLWSSRLLWLVSRV